MVAADVMTAVGYASIDLNAVIEPGGPRGCVFHQHGPLPYSGGGVPDVFGGVLFGCEAEMCFVECLADVTAKGLEMVAGSLSEVASTIERLAEAVEERSPA